MDKIGEYTNTADGNDEFTEGDPGTGTPATEVDGGWLNGVQRELLEVMTQMGLTLSTGDDTLLWQAVQAIYGKTFAGDPNSNVAANVVHERCWDTSTSPPTLYIATAADGTTGGTTWTRFTDLLRAASTTLRGVVELATNTETQAGTDSQRAVTPAGLASALGVTGALVPLVQQNANNDAVIQFTTGIDSTYMAYVFILHDVKIDTDLRTLFVRTSTDGGANFDTASYRYCGQVFGSNGTATDLSGDKQQIEVTLNGDVSNGAGQFLNAALVLWRPSNSNTKSHWHFEVTYQDDVNNLKRAVGGAMRNVVEVIDAVAFSLSSAQFQAGAFRMYGVKLS